MQYDLDGKTADEFLAILRNWREHDVDSPEFSLALYLQRLGEDTDNGIAERLLDWAMDNVEEPAETATDAARQMIETLERIDCAGVFAPSGLVYNHDLGREAGEHWSAIDDALDDYREETGDYPLANGSLTIGHLVWFAYEWNAHRLAGLMRSVFDLDA